MMLDFFWSPKLKDDVLAELAGKLGAEWQRLAAFLKVDTSAVQRIKEDHNKTTDQIYYMLLKWRERTPEGTDLIGALKGALGCVEREDLAETLRTIFCSGL